MEKYCDSIQYDQDNNSYVLSSQCKKIIVNFVEMTITEINNDQPEESPRYFTPDPIKEDEKIEYVPILLPEMHLDLDELNQFEEQTVA
jgi:hypothetical protein